MRIAVITGTTREGRFSGLVAEWISGHLAEHPEFDLEGITGSYHVNGAFDPETSELNLAPGDWVKDPSTNGHGKWSVVGLAGTVQGDSYSGFVTSTACREFSLNKK